MGWEIPAVHREKSPEDQRGSSHGERKAPPATEDTQASPPAIPTVFQEQIESKPQHQDRKRQRQDKRGKTGEQKAKGVKHANGYTKEEDRGKPVQRRYIPRQVSDH